MTQDRPIPVFLSLAFLVLLLATFGCASSKSQSFRSSFLPPIPHTAPDSDPALDTPPPANSDLYGKAMPNPLVAMAAPAKPTDTELRLMRAQERFEAGKRAYGQGSADLARENFDKAIDILLATPENAPDRDRIERRLEQIVDAVYRYDVNGLGSGEDWDKVVYDKSPLDGMLEMTFPIDPRQKSKVKEEIQATVSQLPLEENDSVLGYIHFFSTESGRKILVSGLRRAGRYRPLIERVLREEGVPQELIFLAQAESGFLPRAVSYRQAAGMWQFVTWRGREYGLEQSAYRDDRLDPEKATRAAAKHLHDLYNQFGDWYLAMAAYNCGPGCVASAVQRTGYADFWKLRDLAALPHETTNYVPLILAMTIMVKNPKDYGLDNIDVETPVEYEKVKLAAPTSLSLLADAAELPVSEIRNLNPSLLRSVTPADFEISLPRGSASAVLSALEMIPLNRRATWRMHRVGEGETLASIAKRYRTGAGQIAGANPGFLDSPTAGEVLIIPASYSEAKVTAKKGRSQARAPGISSRSRKGSNAASSVSSRRPSPGSLQQRASAARLKSASLRRASTAE
jgi:membrane-bound lytic murein transglycosylase D